MSHSQDHLSFATFVTALKKGETSFLYNLSKEEKEHIKKCELCQDWFGDLLLRITAFYDCFIWDETHLEPVPEAIIQKMLSAGHQWRLGKCSM